MAGRSYEPEVVVEDITKLTEKEWKEYRYQGIGWRNWWCRFL